MRQLKDLIELEINKVFEDNLDELYQIIKRFVASKEQKKDGVLAKLKKVKIQANPDFSKNIDFYLYGDKIGELK